MPRRTLGTPTSVASCAASVALIAVLGSFSASTATAADLIVQYDQSQLLRLPRPATEVIIGNPSIADVTLQDGNLLVVTGKTFGITNILALDPDHKIIKDQHVTGDAEHNITQEQRVMLERDYRRVVTLHKGSTRLTYTCTPNCEPTLMFGVYTS